MKFTLNNGEVINAQSSIL